MEISDLKDVEFIKKSAIDVIEDLKKELPKINNAKKDDVINAFNTYFIDAFKIDFVKFDDRISRRTFWMYVFFALLIGLVLSPIGLLSKIFFFAVLVPLVVLSVKRMHDIDFSGFWLISIIVPYIGLFFILFLLALPGDKDENRFGKPIK